MSSSMGSSQPKDRTRVSSIAGEFLTVWATREAHNQYPDQESELDQPPNVSYLSHFSRVQLIATLKTVARQAPLSMGILQAKILE